MLRSWIDRLRLRSRTRAVPPAPDPRSALSAPLDRTDDAATEMQARGSAILGLVVVEAGPEPLTGRRFLLRNREARIGRASDCEISIPDPRVSREHARLTPEGASLFLEHRSHTNPTFVNGQLVTTRLRLYHGDHVLLSDDILLRLDAPLLQASAADRRHPPTLKEAMEERVRLETRIRDNFLREGTFLDVDVVDSYGLKHEVSTERIVISFERFRDLIVRTVEASEGVVLNSNGDEVMSFFESAERALAAAKAIAASIPSFNASSNLLQRKFAVRMGIDTGRGAVDLERGVAYSPVLDGAGHLQKAAPTGGILLSQATRDALAGEHAELQCIELDGKRAGTAWLVPPACSEHRSARDPR